MKADANGLYYANAAGQLVEAGSPDIVVQYREEDVKRLGLKPADDAKAVSEPPADKAVHHATTKASK